LVDDQTEEVLLARNDRLISLALAQYGCNPDVLAALFHAAPSGDAVRLACLTNRAAGKSVHPHFPMCIFRVEEEMVKWLNDAPYVEVNALFENPVLDDGVLTNILSRKGVWSDIEERRFCMLLASLYGNPRMRTERSDDWMDGFDEYRYSSVFVSAWRIAESAEPTHELARELSSLYRVLVPEPHAMLDPLSVAAKWVPKCGGPAAEQEEAEMNRFGQLGSFQAVRRGLARLAATSNRAQLRSFLTSSDVALRCAAYGMAALSASEIAAAHAKDGELALDELMENERLWMTHETRKALHDAAWAQVQASESADLLQANIYKAKIKAVREKNPEWFQDSEGESAVADDLPATRGDLREAVTRLDQQAKEARLLTASLDKLGERVNWIIYGLVGAVAAGLFLR